MKNKYVFLFLAFGIAGTIVATYSNHFGNEFHFDDSHTIQDNAYIRSLSNIPLFFKDCTTSSSMPSHQGYRPLVTTTLAIDYALSLKKTEGQNGYDFFFYHLSNFSCFFLIVLLLYFMQLHLYNQIFKEVDNRYLALLGCAWYGLHTANAETVNYIISRSDILSTVAIVASFAIYLPFKSLRKYYIYLIPVAIGMFAKETTIMFAPALIAYDFMIEKRKGLNELFTVKGIRDFFSSIFKGLPALILCIGLAAFGFYMTKKHEPGGSSVLLYAATQPYIILHYVTQFFFPLGLSADTDIPLVTKWSDDRVYIGLAFLIGLVVLAFRTSGTKTWTSFSFGIVWFLLMLLPTSSFVALAEVTNDHRVFLPYIGLIISGVSLAANLYYYRFSKNQFAKLAFTAILSIALSGYAYGTYQRNQVWKTEESLWKDVTEKSPNNGRGWMNYGLTLMAKGDYNGAKYAYDQALQRTPNYYILHVNYAILSNALGQTEETEKHYQLALKNGQNYVEPYYYYGRYLFQHGRIAEAEIYTNKALDIFAGHIYSRYQIMDIYNYEKNWKKLSDAARTTLNIYPDDAKAKAYLTMSQSGSSGNAPADATTPGDLLNQSLALYYAGKYEECIDVCNKVLAMQANSAEAYNNICSCYNQLNKYDSAVLACKKAISLKPDFQLAKNNLAWAESQLKK